MNLSQLFTNNYEYLNTVAKRITRCKNYRMAEDLLSETYINLAEKETEVPDNNEEFVKFFSKCMKNYFAWPNSSFNRLYFPKEELNIDCGRFFQDNKSDYYSIAGRNDEMIIDEDALNDIELQAEETDDFTKEVIEISSSMGKVKALKYIELLEFKRTLPTHESLLFELYFEKEQSTRKIAELYSDSVHKMNYQSVNQMINKIKIKITNYQWRS